MSPTVYQIGDLVRAVEMSPERGLPSNPKTGIGLLVDCDEEDDVYRVRFTDGTHKWIFTWYLECLSSI